MALPELLANSTVPGTATPLTTLNGAIGAADTPIVVAGAAPAALQGSGQFRIVVDAEIMLVTAGAAGTSWTVTRGAEGSTATGHSSGASVYHYLTAGALTAGFVQLSAAYTGTVLGGAGDNQTLGSGAITTTGQLLDVRVGTAGAPDTTLNPVLKVSRTVAIAGGGPFGDASAQVNCISANLKGTGSNQCQLTAMYGVAVNNGTTSAGGANPDSVGGEFIGIINGAGAVGGAFGVVATAHALVSTYRTAQAIQTFTYNDSGADSSGSGAGQATTTGISLFSNGANLAGSALEVVGNAGSGTQQFDVGLHFCGLTANGHTGAIKTTCIRDDSSPVNAIFLGGTYSGNAAIAINSANSGILIGGSNQSSTTAMLELRGSSSASQRPIMIIGAANAFSYGINLLNSSGLHEIAVGAGALITGMAGGDACWRVNTAGKFFHVGGTTSTIKVGADNSLGFFNVTSVAQQSGTGNTHTVTAGSTTSVFTNTTFDGSTGATAYTVGDIVKALKAYGLLAA